VFRQRLLNVLSRDGEGALGDLDGEWQIALWDSSSRTLRLWTDRFGSLPMYWSCSTAGTSFAGGVRGVLTAPGVEIAPDPESLREAVSFGGFRLGDRTNARGVSMAPSAASLTITSGACRISRHWNWSELDCTPDADTDTLLERMRHAWVDAIRRRLEGSLSPGLTLSGGLDSRAILAEATRQRAPMRALTYGVAESDDVRFAARAAKTARAIWANYPLYEAGWLERRIGHILPTDGLMELVDLMHLESLEILPQTFDTLLSGYIGDLVSGGTWADVTTVDDVLGALPYYGGRLGMVPERARERVREILAGTAGPPRFALYDHKLQQAIARITDAARPYVRVRRPFLDHVLFETAHRVPPALRRAHRWHERWLRSTYPEYFRRIPNQRTGAPVGASRLEQQVVRVARYAWRRSSRLARAIGMPVRVPQRSFHPDEPYWQAPAARDVIEGTILRAGSLSCEILGRAAVTSTLSEFFSTGAAPVQVVGAMFVYERYHQTVAASLAEARARAEQQAC